MVSATSLMIFCFCSSCINSTWQVSVVWSDTGWIQRLQRLLHFCGSQLHSVFFLMRCEWPHPLFVVFVTWWWPSAKQKKHLLDMQVSFRFIIVQNVSCGVHTLNPRLNFYQLLLQRKLSVALRIVYPQESQPNVCDSWSKVFSLPV